jgi:ribose-phosphate pyrophosphokinase
MPPLPKEGRYIIVDDICDGGGTFNLLAAAFKKDPLAEKSQLEMFVSHGIFSKGIEAIDYTIEHITTTDSWCQLPSSNRLTVIPLSPVFPKILEASR